MRALTVRCPAKINTVLRVLGRRPDGYHELDTEFVSLALHDTLEIVPAARLSLEVAGDDSVSVEDNLVMRAARALEAHAGRALPARLRLVKRIPSAAGLGGGSSDAAAALVGLDRLHGLATTSEELAALALGVGSDVPYFLEGGRQRGRGRGEILTPLPDRPDAAVLLLSPGRPLSTRAVFEEHAAGPPEGPPNALLTSRNNGTSFPLESWWSVGSVVVHDDLAAAAVRLMPAVGEILRAARREFPEGIVGMTGSGPTVFVLFEDEPANVNDRARTLGAALLTRTVGRAEYQATRFEP